MLIKISRKNINILVENETNQGKGSYKSISSIIHFMEIKNLIKLFKKKKKNIN